MRLTVGTDLVEISRIEQSLKNPRFAARVFSESERAQLSAGGNCTESFAANFAAKEAFSKALGTGVRGFLLSEVSVLRNDLGAPYLVLSGSAEKLASGLSFSVSLTHTGDLAGAVVIAYEMP